jgi:hypothetical protein
LRHYRVRNTLDYDDEVGGPAFVAAFDGLELDPIDAEHDAIARSEVLALSSQIQRKRRSGVGFWG